MVAMIYMANKIFMYLNFILCLRYRLIESHYDKILMKNQLFPEVIYISYQSSIVPSKSISNANMY